MKKNCQSPSHHFCLQISQNLVKFYFSALIATVFFVHSLKVQERLTFWFLFKKIVHFAVHVCMCTTHLQKAKRLFYAAKDGLDDECRHLLYDGADLNAGFRYGRVRQRWWTKTEEMKNIFFAQPHFAFWKSQWYD